MANYHYQVEDCDVDDRELLRRFRDKKAGWQTLLDDDDHAIWPALSEMVWNEVRFDALSAIADANPGGALANQLLSQLALNGHVAIQVLAIRRLVDGTKGVVSLPSLLKDVRKNFEIFTRQNYVCFDGLPYDHQAVQTEQYQLLGAGPRWGDTTGPRAWNSSERAHKKFDQLTGIRPSERSRSDRLPRSLLATIEAWISESGAEEIAKWSHQYLAHAGPRHLREQLGDYGLTGNKIGAAIRGLARATEALSANVLYAGGGGALMPVAHAQFDQFESLMLPVSHSDGTDAGQQRWDALSSDFDECLSGVTAALVNSRQA